MRYLPVLLVCLPLTLAAQSAPATGSSQEPVQALVRSADSTQQVVMRMEMTGRLFAALGVAPDAGGQRTGEIALGPGRRGTGTTPAALEASGRPGAVTFSAPATGPELELTVPGTILRARGRVVRLVRDSTNGPLRAESVATSGR